MAGRIWWLTLLQGILGVILGLLLLLSPDRAAEAVIMFVGIFALAAGILSVVHALVARYYFWGTSITGGLLTIALGLIALFWPGLTATVLVYVVAAWAVLFGLMELIGGVAIGSGSVAGTLTLGVGLVSVVLGVLLFAAPEVGVVAAAWLLGIYFLASGALTVYHAAEVRRMFSRRHVRVA